MSTPRERRNSFASTSFLDIIACGFGAIVLLVLLARDSPDPSVHDMQASTARLEELVAEMARRDEAASRIREIEEQIARGKTRVALGTEMIDLTEQSLGDIDRRIDEHEQRIASLMESMNQQKKENKPPAPKIENVGGIPVDRKYVIFVIDTSGSMQEIWPRVMAQVESLLEAHPKVEGFQVMNDTGSHLISTYARRWIPDSPARRASVLRSIRNWAPMSYSDPVPGIKAALRAYSSYRKDLSIYVMGDEYSGGSYDISLEQISRLNTDPKTRKSQARIHGIGFFNPLTPVTNLQYSTLMREVARQNGGAFVAVAG
ncbi:MAG: VWA domain-containing protein [Gammaproteobacteria bacterium]|nr:VWA domain-containing protein [Gammaproteobacteria bacterium]MCY4313799.1 VWA domain-containing protein [Gammaproteobacteria bacterium]